MIEGKRVVCIEKKYNPGEGPDVCEYTYKGTFIKWGTNIQEDERGFTNETVGIVKLDNGQIKTFLPDNLKVEG